VLFRILGGALVCLSCTLLGIYVGGRGTRRHTALAEFKRSLLMLKSEMEYAIYPLHKAFINISNRTGRPISDFYKQMSEKLLARDKDLGGIWTEGMEVLSTSSLAKEDIDTIAVVGRALGSIDASVQLASIDMTITAIDDAINMLNEENAKNGRMYKSIGIVSGLLITIVLL